MRRTKNSEKRLLIRRSTKVTSGENTQLEKVRPASACVIVELMNPHTARSRSETGSDRSERKLNFFLPNHARTFTMRRK